MLRTKSFSRDPARLPLSVPFSLKPFGGFEGGERPNPESPVLTPVCSMGTHNVESNPAVWWESSLSKPTWELFHPVHERESQQAPAALGPTFYVGVVAIRKALCDCLCLC